MGTNRPRVQRWIIRVHMIMTAASCSPAVASRHAKYDDDFRVQTLLDAQQLDLAARMFANPPRELELGLILSRWLWERGEKGGASHNVDMAIEPKKGGKLAHGRLQSTLPVRAKTHRQQSRLMGPLGCSAGAAL